MRLKDFIFDTFLRLTSKTVPYGYEAKFVFDVMQFLFPEGIQKDKHGNYFYSIGESRTIFASHLDTVSKDYVNVVTNIEDGIVRTDGKTTLGADDKAGVTVMLWMIKNRVPGFYYFFIGEEVGCIGSGLAAKYEDIKGNYDRIISFDRRGTDSVITYQSSGRCCSDSFADSLCEELNKSGMSYKKDDGGVYTDSAEFMDIISECTNISVGYYKEHTTDESQDLNHLEKLAEACVNVNWEDLPVERDPSKIEYKSWSRYDWEDWDNPKNYSTYDDYHDVYSTRRKKTRRGKKSKTYYDDGSGELKNLSKRGKNYLNKLLKDKDDDYNTDKYSWILNKLCNDKFTYHELQTIKDNYLDLDSEYDKWFFEYLKEQAIDY